jgi:hypothetical protein
MIPVSQAPEPPEFDGKVRQPGLSAIDELVGRAPRLKRTGPRRKKFVNKEEDLPAEAFPPYWREALPEMLVAYERRCAYLAMYIHHATRLRRSAQRCPNSPLSRIRHTQADLRVEPPSPDRL